MTTKAFLYDTTNGRIVAYIIGANPDACEDKAEELNCLWPDNYDLSFKPTGLWSAGYVEEFFA